MLLTKLIFLIIPFLATANLAGKNENAAKIKKATKLMQEAMLLLQETAINIDEQDLLDPANYQKALDYIKEGKFSLAKQILIAFSKGEDEKAAQAFYWLGVCFLEEKNYEKAMIALVNFLHKIEDREVSAMILDMKKISYKYLVRCYERLYRPIDACAIVLRMEKEYPDESAYVKNAYEYLKCGQFKSTKEARTDKSSPLDIKA